MNEKWIKLYEWNDELIGSGVIRVEEIEVLPVLKAS